MDILSIGFFFWGTYMMLYPLFQANQFVSAGFLIAAMLQVLIAVSMVILVLEQIRYNHQRRASRAIRTYQSENVLLETKIHSTEERYRYLFDQAGEAIIITNGDLQILELNYAAEHLLGITRAQ